MAQFWHPTGSIISPDNPGSRLLSTVSPSSTLRAHLPGLCRPASRIRWRSPVALARRETTTQASQGDLALQSAPQDEEDPPPRPREGPLTWVELSGLEPLTSCMPCTARTSGTVGLGGIPGGQRDCTVRPGPAAPAGGFLRCHLISH